MPKKKSANPANKAIKKAIKQYYEALQAYRDQRVTHEGALQTAFQHLLGEAARVHHCTLIPQQPYKKLRPDGTVRDTLWDRAMGYWEAKDTNDNLDKEIAVKIQIGYRRSLLERAKFARQDALVSAMIIWEAIEMSMHVKAIYENGVFRPLESVQLPERQEVTVTVDGHVAESAVISDQLSFALTSERWQSFCDALDAAPREIPALRKLLTEKSLFDGNPTSSAKSSPA